MDALGHPVASHHLQQLDLGIHGMTSLELRWRGRTHKGAGMRWIVRGLVLAAGLSWCAVGAAQEQVRTHPRLKKEVPEGQRTKLSIGTLFVPKELKREGTVPLFVHFHGGDWLPEVAAVRHGRTAVITVQLGSGSAVYGKPFEDAKAFGTMLAEAEQKAGVKFGPITLTAWSAGYGAVRAILRQAEHYDRVQG